MVAYLDTRYALYRKKKLVTVLPPPPPTSKVVTPSVMCEVQDLKKHKKRIGIGAICWVSRKFRRRSNLYMLALISIPWIFKFQPMYLLSFYFFNSRPACTDCITQWRNQGDIEATPLVK